MKEHFFIYNNTFFYADEPVISAGNRSLLYGDGLFETMRMREGGILNMDFHFERFFLGLKILQFDAPEYFSSGFFLQKINALLLKNGDGINARIRLMTFRGKGSILNPENNFPNYILETSPLPKKMKFNETGLVVDIFPDGKKSCDIFSNLKSNNYLMNAMAGLFARKNKLDDCILLNVSGRLCESAIANIFIIKDENIYTPPLTEGCVAGVMRRWMLERFSLKNYRVTEKKLSLDEVLDADEFFVTNSIHPVKWIKNFRGKIYANEKVKEVFQYISKSI